ncbi:unnamed protein product (macronuclear) [Paramecium tetraurelia]|uniref:Zinc-finger domain-containing protein n=1 Tax=Paramecium tetraurelia TaxID=5888 RepID=A0BP96_PARTE|nr:uncharacterized protein GSPATT00005112001 [Paramecium tetraurelia]CAK60363.1 unnamed protein product [Paramecium tetraurelia]|eukprot:XP_001427761.1 hypothetical protein (macronuclear) [Paramecium tetraurelia strain d4-2]
MLIEHLQINLDNVLIQIIPDFIILFNKYHSFCKRRIQRKVLLYNENIERYSSVFLYTFIFCYFKYIILGMSEENQLNADKNQNKNNLEKIIKLDKKNGNFDIYDKYSRRKLKIRTSQNNSYINSSYQNEYILCYFWRHINQVYFKKVDEPEQERLEYLKAMNDDAIVTEFPINLKQITDLIRKQNLLGEYLEAHQVERSHSQSKSSENTLDRENILHETKINDISSLIQENAQLDKLLDKLNEQIELRTGQKDEIFQQLQEYSNELQQLNKSNKKDLQNLTQKIKSEQPLNVFGTQVHIYKQARGNNNLSKNQIIYNNEALLTYLRKSLEQLDFRQTAESIVKVINSVHSPNGYQFCVAFEQALNSTYVNIDEDLMYELDKLRDTSLFKFYNIPQKTKYSHIAQNFVGINQVQQNRQKPNPLINKNLTKESKASQSGDNDSTLLRYEACHHCKMLFREEYLISCNYRSGTMGLPIINSSITDSYLFTQMDDEGIKSRRQVPNRKKTAYSIYSKKNGELICQRKFCRMCLKQNYDIKIEEVIQKTDWVCPFCQAICFCSRCQRNDIMIKLKDLYTICGGDLEQLTKDSIFEKYVRPLTDDQLYRKKPSQLQRTGYSFVKQQLNNFKDMQAIRLDFENLRLLCSQLMRREKMKWRMLEQDILIWNNEAKQQKQQKLQKSSITKSVQKKQKDQKKLKKITKKAQKSDVQYIQELSSSSSFSSSSSEYQQSSEYESEENDNNNNNNSNNNSNNNNNNHKQNNEKINMISQKMKQKNIKQVSNDKQQSLNKILQNYKSFPAKNVKREVAYLLQYQDSDTYSLIVKKIKQDQSINSLKR